MHRRYEQSPPGDQRRQSTIVGGYRVSLEDIEHGLLRSSQGHPFIPGPQFSVNDPRLQWAVHVLDPRTHFALNCASLSCPPIRVYNSEHIDEQLNLAARSFIDAHLTLDPVRQRITLSSIFRWFRRDFGGREGIIKFIANNLSPNDTRRAWLLDYQETIRFAQESYDWRLNRRLEEEGL